MLPLGILMVQSMSRAAQPRATTEVAPVKAGEWSAEGFSWTVCGEGMLGSKKSGQSGLSLLLNGRSIGSFVMCDAMLLVRPTWCLVSKSLFCNVKCFYYFLQHQVLWGFCQSTAIITT